MSRPSPSKRRNLHLVLAGALGFGVSWLLIQSQVSEVPVPQVLGLPREAAESALKSAGLRVEVEEAEPAPGQAPGSALSLDPPPGSLVKTSRLIRLRVARKTAAGALPSVLGLDLSAARSLLSRKNIQVLETLALDWPGGTADQVLGQDPEAGSPAFQGAGVRLLVATGQGRRRYLCPDLSLQELDPALASLTLAGLKARPEGEASDSVPPGRILSQSPGPGEMVQEGAEMRLGVSQNRGLRAGGTSRVVTLAFQIPSTYDGPVSVHGDLEDAEGRRRALDGVYQPGELVQKTLTVRGQAKVTLRYPDGLEMERSWPGR